MTEYNIELLHEGITAVMGPIKSHDRFRLLGHDLGEIVIEHTEAPSRMVSVSLDGSTSKPVSIPEGGTQTFADNKGMPLFRVAHSGSIKFK